MTPLQPIKQRLWLLLLLLGATITAMFLLKQCTSPGQHPAGGYTGVDPTATDDSEAINVAIELSPMALSTQGDTLGGHYYLLMKRIAQHHGLNVRFIPFSQIADAMNSLEQGDYHVLIADQPVTASMRERFLYTDPVAVDHLQLVQLRDSLSGELPVPTSSALRGKEVWVAEQSPFATRLHHLARELGDTIIVRTSPSHSTEQLAMLVALGRINLTVANSQSIAPLLKRYPHLDASVSVGLTQLQSWAVTPKRPELRDSLNLWLQQER